MVEKDSQMLGDYHLKNVSDSGSYMDLPLNKSFCPRLQIHTFQFLKFVQHDMLVPRNQPVPALLTVSSNSSSKSSCRKATITDLVQEYISLSIVPPRL